MKRMHEGYRILNNRLAGLHIAANNLLLMFEERLPADFALTSLEDEWRRSCKLDLSLLPEPMRTDAVTAIAAIRVLSRRVQSSLRRTKTPGDPPSVADREAIDVLVRAQRYCGEMASRSPFEDADGGTEVAKPGRETVEQFKKATGGASADSPTQKANEKMIAIYTNDRSSAGWTSQLWADQVGCDSSTIRKTGLWKALRAEREAMKQSGTVKTRGCKPVKR